MTASMRNTHSIAMGPSHCMPMYQLMLCHATRASHPDIIPQLKCGVCTIHSSHTNYTLLSSSIPFFTVFYIITFFCIIISFSLHYLAALLLFEILYSPLLLISFNSYYLDYTKLLLVFVLLSYTDVHTSCIVLNTAHTEDCPRHYSGTVTMWR